MKSIILGFVSSIFVFSYANATSEGVEGCSHSYRELAGNTYSNIEFALNYDKIDATIGLAKEEKKNSSIPVVGTIYTKDGTPVERTGSVIYWYENGKYSSTQDWLPLRVNKDEYIADFGKYPKVSCKVVGMQ
ncbi:hypothetical protein N9M53_03375 [Alphaproteobacteria bacterium]|jgi:hypothetical protein|nr:hypothetical protein [Alphaproteobacteria bacterium]